MSLKDTVVGLFIKRFVIPGAQFFNKPGFVDFKISGKTPIYARQIFYPEDFFVKFEKDMVATFGDVAKADMYSLGKKFGYRFAQAGKFENINDHPGNKIKEWVFIASKFVEGTYARSIENKTYPEIKKTEYFLENFVILRKLGFDYIFALGGSVGLMAWIYQDTSIEGFLQGVKKEQFGYSAIAISAPISYLKEKHSDQQIFVETDLSDLLEDFDLYVKFNKQVKTSRTKSFQNYLDAKFIDYKQGIVTIKNHRLFLFEVSGTYLMEYELKKKNSKYLDILSSAAFYAGEQVFADFSSDIDALFSILSAIGWGEVLLFVSSDKQIKVLINHFPWSRWYKDIDFIIVRGFLSGIFTKLKGKKIEFKKPVIDLGNDHLSLLFEGNL